MPDRKVTHCDQGGHINPVPESTGLSMPEHEAIPRHHEGHTTPFPAAAGLVTPEKEEIFRDREWRTKPFPEPPGQALPEHEVIQSAFEAGLETLLLRKPGWNESDYARWLERLPTAHRAKVIVATFPSLVESFMLKGVHLSEEARAKTAPSEIRKLHEAGKWVSTSIHHESTDVSGFDFVLMGPVFDSISKPGYNARPYPSIPPNAIAIGGIHAGNVAAARAKGFRGAAVLGAAWKEPDRMNEIISSLINAWPSSKNSIHRLNPGV